MSVHIQEVIILPSVWFFRNETTHQQTVLTYSHVPHATHISGRDRIPLLLLFLLLLSWPDKYSPLCEYLQYSQWQYVLQVDSSGTVHAVYTYINEPHCGICHVLEQFW